ncbi:hypothetical protein QC762_0066690 [Podospora pseudocomata]|uniref:Uncharacterized protein n=1 Tax=Podospora pseudocomata TaxID=2093779 RepID=A0ABR0GFT3_9PEZI|nr:hypothetical protein QC762_0066690 [Podospora pseudocomata]
MPIYTVSPKDIEVLTETLAAAPAVTLQSFVRLQWQPAVIGHIGAYRPRRYWGSPNLEKSHQSLGSFIHSLKSKCRSHTLGLSTHRISRLFAAPLRRQQPFFAPKPYPTTMN